ncbi:MAG: hypothetical protein OXI08_08920 [Cyanobacteria bacterium MAG IRC4_bin_6]|nr:hypothetical protein [Cyanobacteria bacterium MAG IRC4_bin_6]
MRRLIRIPRTKVPDKTTILNFPHLLGRHGLGKVLFASSKEHLAEQGPRRQEGTMCQHPCGAVTDEEQ